MNIFQKAITPDMPRVLEGEQIYVYVPQATSTNAGIASYKNEDFKVNDGVVSLRWPAKSLTQGPLANPSLIKVQEDEFEYTNAKVNLDYEGSRLTSSVVDVQLKRDLRDAYDRPDLVMLDPTYFPREIIEKDGKQYYKYNTTAVHYIVQALTDAQKRQARENINASSNTDIKFVNDRIDELLETIVYTVNGQAGNVVLTTNDIMNNSDYTTNAYVNEQISALDTNKADITYVDQQISALDTDLDTKMDKSGGIFTGNVGVQGNLSVSGTITTKDTETLKVQDNVIVTNANKIDLLDLSGLAINKNDTQTYGIMYDVADDSVKLGLGSIDSAGKFTFNEGDGSPVATRSDSSLLIDNHLIKWDATNNKLVDSGYSAEDKLDKISTSSTHQRVYGINSDGTQTTYNVSVQPEKDTVVCRDYYGRIGSETFYANYINNLEDWDTNPERRTHIALEPKSFEMVSYIGSQVSGLKFTNDTDTNSDDMSIFGEFMGSKTTPDYAKQIGFSMNYNNVSYLENGIMLRVLENLQNGKILSLTQNGLFIGDGFDAIPEGEQTLPLKNKKEISPNTIRYDIEQTLTDEQKAQARANIGAGTGAGTGSGTTVTVGGVAQETWDADSKVNKTVDTYSINIDNSGIVLKNLNSSDQAEIGISVLSSGASLGAYTADAANSINLGVDEGITIGSATSEQNTLILLQPNTMEIGHTKGDKVHKLLVNENGIGIYDKVVVDGNTLQGVVNAFTGMAAIQAFSDTSGGGITVQPNIIEIETPKLTYNGNEVATVNQLSSTPVESVNGKTGAVVLYANDVGAVATDDIVDNLITEDTTKVLSANQGKVLAERDAATNQQLTLAKAAITAIQGDVSTLQNSVSENTEDITQNMANIADINKKIPTQASETNKLADKAFVNSTINSSAAFFKGSFESKAALDAVQWQTTDSSLTTYVTNNDYAYIESDETHNNEAWRYIYVKNNTVSEWQPQFRVNESPFTQAQLDAINSGATADLINSINSKLTQDSIVDNTGDSSTKAISQRAATLGINAVQNNLNTHISNTNNPHNVTKAQVGLGNVNNTSDLDKPISIAVQNALEQYLPLTGGTITGQLNAKKFYLDISSKPSSPQYKYIDYLDTNNKRIGVVGALLDTTGYYGTYMQAGNVGSIGIKTDGTKLYAWAPTPDKTSNGNTIATTKFVKDVVTGTAYGTCSTASATSAKVVTIADTSWQLKAGTIIGVFFQNNNSASNVTLNVNNTGAKNIWYNNANYTGNSVNICGSANRIIYYMYSGTVWVWLSNSNNVNTDTIPAISWTAAGTSAKTASYTNYQLLAKSYFNIIMTNANTSKTALTLNVNGKGAKPIYINGTASSTTNYTLPAGSYIVYYDGTNYHFRTDGVLEYKEYWSGTTNTPFNEYTIDSISQQLLGTSSMFAYPFNNIVGNMTRTTNAIKITTTGYYEISFDCEIVRSDITSSNLFMYVKNVLNKNETSLLVRRNNNLGTDKKSLMSASGIFYLYSDSIVQLYYSKDNNNITGTIDNLNFTIRRI